MARKPKAAEPAADVVRVILFPLDELTPNVRNSRRHDDAQIAAIKTSIRTYGWTNPILADVLDDALIVAGHGRRLAAREIYAAGETIKTPNGKVLPPGMVPIIDCSGWTEEQRRAYTIADNRLTDLSSFDEEILRLELGELRDLDVDLSEIGFTDADIEKLFAGDGGAADDVKAYTRKIEAPIYEPKGDTPSVSELFDDAKTRELVDEIRAADLPVDVAEFLERAAERHTVFDFRRIADFYASADAPTQRLMERSALVIVDFDQAIANGFVKLTERLGELAAQSTRTS